MDTFTSFDGTTIAYLDDGSGDPVVLHHGFAADHVANWVAPGVVGALVEAGRRVIALDARGHGASGKPHDSASYVHGAMIEDLRGLADHLGLEQFDLVGYSMGASVSAGLAPDEPRIRRLVLGGIGAGVLSGRGARSGEQLAAALEADDPESIGNPVGRAFRAFADSTGADRLALGAIARANAMGTPPRVGDITTPTLVLCGEGDTLVGDPHALAEAIPDAQEVVIGGDHLGAVADPAFITTIVDFLED